MDVKISINKESSFVEVWREGYVVYNKEKYYFWLIDPCGKDEFGKEYNQEVRWWHKNVPKEVRALYNQIIENFKYLHEK